MKSLFTQLHWIRYFNGTRRFHTEKFSGTEETVAHHSANVAAILIHMLPEESCTKNLLKAAILHDTVEGFTGDIPHPAKLFPELKANVKTLEEEVARHFEVYLPDLTALETLRLKAADVLDGMFTCLDQIRAGNLHLNRVFQAYVDYAMQTQCVYKANSQKMEILFTSLITVQAGAKDGFGYDEADMYYRKYLNELRDKMYAKT